MPIPNSDILQILKEVNKGLSRENSLSSLAIRSGWSKFYFHRAFERLTGESPKAYVQRVKLDNAATALSVSKKSVLQISLEFGFKSQEVFIRAFKRRFRCTPQQFRKHKTIGIKAKREDQISTVRAISPCVRLYQLRENLNFGRKAMTQLRIERMTLEPQPVLFIQRKISQSELQPYFAECFGKLFSHGVENALPITGNPIARYVSIGPGLWTVDCILPLAHSVEDVNDFQAGVLAGGDVLKATHLGPYEDLEASYIQIQTMMDKEGLISRGAHWEQYVTDPGEEPDPTKWQTDIYWPVK